MYDHAPTRTSSAPIAKAAIVIAETATGIRMSEPFLRRGFSCHCGRYHYPGRGTAAAHKPAGVKYPRRV